MRIDDVQALLRIKNERNPLTKRVLAMKFGQQVFREEAANVERAHARVADALIAALSLDGFVFDAASKQWRKRW